MLEIIYPIFKESAEGAIGAGASSSTGAVAFKAATCTLYVEDNPSGVFAETLKP